MRKLVAVTNEKLGHCSYSLCCLQAGGADVTVVGHAVANYPLHLQLSPVLAISVSTLVWIFLSHKNDLSDVCYIFICLQPALSVNDDFSS